MALLPFIEQGRWGLAHLPKQHWISPQQIKNHDQEVHFTYPQDSENDIECRAPYEIQLDQSVNVYDYHNREHNSIDFSLFPRTSTNGKSRLKGKARRQKTK
jgi:hypothetical protein